MEYKKAKIIKVDKFDIENGIKVGDIVEVRQYRQHGYKDRHDEIYTEDQLDFNIK
ncbi:hypothetical protein UT300005_05400 [Clostridium sp. CTA-5]